MTSKTELNLYEMQNSELFKLALKYGLRVLDVDIETAPDLSWHYGNREVNIDPKYTEIHTQITSVALYAPGDRSPTLLEWERPTPGTTDFLKPDKDKKLLQILIPILNQTDLLIGQNINSFDMRKLRWRAQLMGLPPIKEIPILDSLRMSQKVFYAPSHRLDFKSTIYGYGGKIKQDMLDCVNVAKGDIKASNVRGRYNKKDTQDDLRKSMREMDHWLMPETIKAMLRSFIEGRDICYRCEANRKRKGDVVINAKELICQNCGLHRPRLNAKPMRP